MLGPKGKPEKIKNILDPILARTGLKWRVKEQKIIEGWKHIVGADMARNTEAVKFRGGILYIKVSNSTWMQQLQFLKKMIIDKLQGEIKDISIDDIRFFIGEIQTKTEYLPAAEKDTEIQEAQQKGGGRGIFLKEVAEELAQIKDGEIRKLLATLYTKRREISQEK